MKRILLLFLFFAALALAVLGANPLRGEAITPFDLLAGQRAWSWIDPDVEVRSGERSDIINALVPKWLDARTQLRNGGFPTWSDTSGGVGLVTPNFSTWTPGFAIFAATPDPALGFHLAIAFNLAMAGLGMYLFLRRHLGRVAAFVGAFTFMFCGFQAAWLYWPHVFTVIWAPWLLLAIDRCSEKPGFPRALGIAIASALVALGGFPFLAVLVFEAGALYTLVLLAMTRSEPPARWRFLLWYACGVALGILLAALPLYELVAWMRQLDLGYREGRGSYLDMSHVDRLLPPWSYAHKRVEQTMYVGLAMTVLAAATPLMLLARRMRLSPLPVFGLALLLVSAGLVFEFWPMGLVGWLPGMSYNSWSRAISLLDIALIVLGSAALDRLWTGATACDRLWPRVLILVLALVQCVEIAAFFRRYNGPASAGFFYPRTPATSYLRQHAGAFDYVIADRSFGTAGTLGAYGLREWHAHQFHPPQLKRALGRMARKPFISRTAARIEAENIRSRSSLLADFNVRYLAVSSDDGARSATEGKQRPLPPLPRHRWRQHFTLDRKATLHGISLNMATYGRSDLEGAVVLELFDDAGHRVGSARVDATHLKDNDLEDFYFDQPLRLAPGRYAFSVAYLSAAGRPAGELTAWAGEPQAQAAPLTVDEAPFAGTLDYRLHLDERRFPGFRRVLTSADISVYENTGSPGGPYFVADLARHAGPRSSEGISVRPYRPDRFTLRYDGNAAGYVVVPMTFTPEWVVHANGAPAKVAMRHGVMPAVAVSGPATLDFHYVPAASRWRLPWLAVLGLVLGMLCLLHRFMRTPPGRSTEQRP